MFPGVGGGAGAECLFGYADFEVGFEEGSDFKGFEEVFPMAF